MTKERPVNAEIRGLKSTYMYMYIIRNKGVKVHVCHHVNAETMDPSIVMHVNTETKGLRNTFLLPVVEDLDVNPVQWFVRDTAPSCGRLTQTLKASKAL